MFVSLTANVAFRFTCVNSIYIFFLCFFFYFSVWCVSVCVVLDFVLSDKLQRFLVLVSIYVCWLCDAVSANWCGTKTKRNSIYVYVCLSSSSLYENCVAIVAYIYWHSPFFLRCYCYWCSTQFAKTQCSKLRNSTLGSRIFFFYFHYYLPTAGYVWWVCVLDLFCAHRQCSTLYTLQKSMFALLSLSYKIHIKIAKKKK